MQQKGIHWFPGHMQKALRQIEERLKIIDVVIELLDARAPLSCRNDYLYNMTASKKRLIILTKLDLADKEVALTWVDYFSKNGNQVILANLNDKNIVQEITKRIQILGSEKQEKAKRRGMKPQPIKTMIIGIPNVGKSTLINRLAKRSAASVQNTPGHTRSQQWIKIGNDFELLDTPGVLPAHYEDKNFAINLALIGSIKQDILPISDLVSTLINFLKLYYIDDFKKLYDLTDDILKDDISVLTQIAKRRGLLSNKGYDLDKAENLLLKEFKDGKICRACLERIGD